MSGVGSSVLLALLDEAEEFLVLLLVHAVAVVVDGEGSRLDLVDVLPDALHRDLREVGEALGELRLEVGENNQEIVAKQDLAVGADASADPDSRDLDLLRD